MNTKKCSRCKRDLELEKFSKSSRKDGLQNQCKECHKEYRKKHYIDNKKKYIDKSKNWRIRERVKFYNWLKEQSCKDCGNKDFRVLECDHLHDKSYDISKRLGAVKFEILKKELDKCEIVCANCHRIRTAEQFSQYKYLE